MTEENLCNLCINVCKFRIKENRINFVCACSAMRKRKTVIDKPFMLMKEYTQQKLEV
jgi:hypothetical protein